MFGAIAGSYDLLNHLLSLNLDRRWRKQAARLADLKPGEDVLDVCCGTGDLGLAFLESQPRLGGVVGADFCLEMLHVAKSKKLSCSRIVPAHSTSSDNTLADNAGGRSQRGARAANNSEEKTGRCNTVMVKWLCADAQRLCVLDERFDCVCCAFGLRNVADPALAVKEAYRVLRPGGRLVVLEFATPTSRLLKWAYQIYFRLVLPVLGSLIARDRCMAYHYLPASVGRFDAAGTLTSMMNAAGFQTVCCSRLTYGVVVALLARKP